MQCHLINIKTQCTCEKMQITFLLTGDWTPATGFWIIQSLALYCITLKKGLYCKAVQVCYMHILSDIPHFQIEIHPWISRSPRITWNVIQGVFLCTYVGYLHWASNVTGEKCRSHFLLDSGLYPGCRIQSPALYRIAIKAGLYRKAVQVCYIHILSSCIHVLIFFF